MTQSNVKAISNRLLPSLVFVTAMSVLITFAVLASGKPTQKLDLHDTGIWVTNDSNGMFGRLNKSASSLDGALTPPGTARAKYLLDVLQDGPNIIGHDIAGSKLLPVEPATMGFNVSQAALLPAKAQIAMKGGTVATLDPETGDIKAVRYQSLEISLDLQSLDAEQPTLSNLVHKDKTPEPVKDKAPPKPSLNGVPAALTVAIDGTVYAGTGDGTLVTIPVTDSGFGDPKYSTFVGGLKAIQMATVGSKLAIYDEKSGKLILDGREQPAPKNGIIQSSSADADTAIIATENELHRVGAETETVFKGAKGKPATPVNVGGCTFAAWSGSPGTAIRACPGAPPVQIKIDRNRGTLIRPVFRINHDQIVLNDQATGLVVDLDLERSVDNWDEIKPKQETEEEKRDKKDSPEQLNKEPKANDDKFGARSSRTTVMHVLDNDADPVGNIMAVTAVTQPSVGSVDISPDGQTVQFTMPETGQNTSFTYTVSNGINTSKPATVTVEHRSPDQNEAPKLRAGAKPAEFAVASWGSVLMPVAGDYRDYDGDPVTVLSAKDNKDRLPVTADGRVDFTAGKAEKLETRRIEFEVSDGIVDTPVTGAVKVQVLAHNATQGTPPITQPDAARGEVGKPITIRPLENDIPGSDPLNPRSELKLGAKIQATDVIKTETDETAGQVLVTASKPGTYFLNYSAAFGSSRFASGQIRVDVAPATNDSSPVAVPDQAAIRGEVPIMVDVLANDFDPMGSVLVVDSVEVDKQYAEQVQAASYQGRWVRIMPLKPDIQPNPFVIKYTITNGRSKSVAGSISVTQLPAVERDRAMLRDDFAVVRDGDSTLIPVLSNDSSESGAPIVLDTNIKGLAAGELKVVDPNVAADADQGDVGKAYVVGDRVRYVAPKKVTEPKQFRIEYVASTVGGEPKTAMISVTVNPQPDEKLVNQPPAPVPVEARGVSGDTITIPIETSGRDPDGDTVIVSGIGSAPKLGRILSHSPVSLTYQAFPENDSAGTDSFRYEVMDKYGARSTSVVRIALTPPGQTQPPVAVADVMTVQPGADVELNPKGNDLFAIGDPPTVTPLETVNKPVPQGVTLDAESGRIRAKAPGADQPPLVFGYALSGNGGVGPSAKIAISSREGYLNPPRVFDQIALREGGKTEAKVNLLAGAWDPDGSIEAAKVTRVGDAGGPATGNEVSIPLTESIQIIPFEVTDADGAVSAAVIFVPAAGDGPPQLKAGGLIEMAANSSLSVKISDYVESPRDRDVRITVAESLSAAPAKGLSVSAENETAIKLTSKGDYVGPGSVTLEVIDAKDMSDKEALRAYVTIPVQVGPVTPVLRCPDVEQKVMQGGQKLTLDIVNLCHVWTADPKAARELTFAASWAEPLADVKEEGGKKVSIQAAGIAVPDSRGRLKISIPDSEAKPSEFPVRVVRAPKPRLVLNELNDVKQGTSVTQALALSSPLVDAQPTIVSFNQSGGMPAQATFEGTSFTVTPGPDSHGRMQFSMVASDVADTSRTDRQVTGVLRVVTYGRPEAPGTPVPGQQLQTHAASLTWRPGADNGAPIEEFELRWQGGSTGTKSCGRATRCDVTGLRNGQNYTFSVRARNKADWSEWSGWSSPVMPDEPPGAASGFTTSNPQDHSLTLTWNPAPVDGSPVSAYHITWGGGAKDVSGSTTSTTVSGLDNNTVYTFTIVAENRAGLSKLSTTTKGQSAGAPMINPPSINSSDLGDKAQVRVSWAAANPNGWTPVTYTLLRSDGQTYQVGQSTSAVHDVTYDGTKYSYTVKACNAAPGDGHCTTSGSASWTAVGKPAKPPTPQLRATGSDNQLELADFTVPLARGARAIVSVVGSINKQLTTQSGTSTFSLGANTLSYGNGQTATIRIQLCNESGACTESDSASATPYGPLPTPNLENPSVNGTTVSASATGDGKGAEARLILYLNGSECNRSGTSTGQLFVSCSRDLGYAQNGTFYVKIEDASNKGRGTQKSPEKTVRTVDKPPPPPANPTYRTFRGGDAMSSGYCESFNPCNFVDLELRNWRPNSSVYCWANAVGHSTAFKQTFNVDGNGNWGRGRTRGIMGNINPEHYLVGCEQR